MCAALAETGETKSPRLTQVPRIDRTRTGGVRLDRGRGPVSSRLTCSLKLSERQQEQGSSLRGHGRSSAHQGARYRG